MKKVIIILLVLAVVAIAGVVVFLATFDLNRYNKTLASQIESIVGNPVEIGRLSLGWKGNLSLGVEKFQILVEKDGQKTPELSFDRADMALELLPLLKGQLNVSSISVTQPRIHVVRAKDGKIELIGYSPKATAPAVAAKPAAIPVAVNFSISSITIRGGTLRLEDFTGEPPADILIDALDADIKNVSLSTPVQFAVKMAMLSNRQNVNITGTAGGFVTAPLYLKDLNIDADLGAIDHAKLMQAVPALQKLGIKEGIGGRLITKVPDLQLVDNKISKISADIAFSDGRLALAWMKVPVERASLSASIDNDKISIKSFSVALANATLKGSGVIVDIFTLPKSALRFDAEISEVKQFLSSLVGGRQYLEGKIALSFDGTMTGNSWGTISKTLSGSGAFSLDSGILLDTNIIRQSLGAITLFPGLLDSLNSYLPAAVMVVLNQQNTLLKPIHQSFAIKDGVAAIPDLKFDTGFASVGGQAMLTLQGELAGNGTISFAPELSSAMIKSVPQMRYLADAKGNVGFPITFKASGAGASVMPDLQYIASRAAMQKGQEMLSDLLKKTTEPKEQPQAGQASGQQKQSFGINDIMKNVKALSEDSKGASNTQ